MECPAGCHLFRASKDDTPAYPGFCLVRYFFAVVGVLANNKRRSSKPNPKRVFITKSPPTTAEFWCLDLPGGISFFVLPLVPVPG